MFLSRLKMPLAHPAAQRLLADLYVLHRALMRAFPPRATRVLFRIEPYSGPADHAVILVQSLQEPDWSADAVPPVTAVECKAFDPTFRTGQRLRFRLLANPTARRRTEGRDDTVRVGLLKEEAQRAWLERKGERGGFRPQSVIVMNEGRVLGHKPGGDRRMTFQSIRFEGILQVTDPERFRDTLAAGIGSAKAFGFGLLSLARAGP